MFWIFTSDFILIWIIQDDSNCAYHIELSGQYQVCLNKDKGMYLICNRNYLKYKFSKKMHIYPYNSFVIIWDIPILLPTMCNQWIWGLCMPNICGFGYSSPHSMKTEIHKALNKACWFQIISLMDIWNGLNFIWLCTLHISPLHYRYVFCYVSLFSFCRIWIWVNNTIIRNVTLFHWIWDFCQHIKLR